MRDPAFAASPVDADAAGATAPARARLEAAVAASGAAMFEYRFAEDRIEWLGGTRDFFGHPPQAIVRLADWLRHVLPEDRVGFEAAIIDACAAPSPNRSVRYRIRDASGEVRWLETHGRVLWDGDTPYCATGLTIDVTVQAQQQQELQLHSQVLDAIADGVTMAHEDGTILMVNRAMEQMHGWSREELIGQSTSIFSGLSSTEHRRLRDHVQQVVVREGRWHGETLERRRDGTPLRVRRSIALLHNGRERLWVGTRTDVSKQRELEREVLEASEHEQARLARFLHESLGQDLTGAAMLASVIAAQAAQCDAPFAADAARLARLLGESVTRCRRLAQEVRGFTLSTAGLEAAVQSLARECEAEHGVGCVARTDPEFAAALDQDRAQLVYRVVAESLEAALSAGAPSHIVIDVGVAGERGHARLSDDGSGLFDPDRIRRIGYRAGMLFGALAKRIDSAGGRTLEVSFPLT